MRADFFGFLGSGGAERMRLAASSKLIPFILKSIAFAIVVLTCLNLPPSQKLFCLPLLFEIGFRFTQWRFDGLLSASKAQIQN
ncbi:MAG: hypothetical protein ACREFE_10575 [Limisphaerales bacterium]